MSKPQLVDSKSTLRLHDDQPCLKSDLDDSPYVSACDSHERIHMNINPLGNVNVKNFEYIDIIISVMADIYKSLKGSGFQLLLADENGLIIEHFPSHESILFNNWNEDIIGTNAIGTAIKIKKPVQVSGAEHYRKELVSLTSSAVPIFNQHGKPFFVLALVGPNCQDHSHIISMLHKAVIMIAYKWTVTQKTRQVITYNNYLRNIINIMNDGIIIVANTGNIKLANPIAAKILGKQAHELIGISLGTICKRRNLLDEMLRTGTSFSNVELFSDSPSGRIHCLASGEPSYDEKGNTTGGIIVLHSIEKVHKMVNSFCGTRAELSFNDIIGSSKKIKDCIDMARMYSKSMCNVLLQGESGTGKDIFAQAIHNESSRFKGPFVVVNCGAIPRELIGSELFGYVDGAFTGACRGGRPGKFELAAGGTLFLDEIGDMPPDQQVVLLRVLEDKLVTRIGDSKEIPVDVRVIFATNKDLLREVQKGNFRLDLYYRLNVVSITIPPLRDRREDIPPLINHYLMKLNINDSTKFNLMNPAVMQYLTNYNWPGNVRELQNVLERLVIIANTRQITAADLPPEIYKSKNTVLNEYEQVFSVPDVQESYKQKKNELIAEKESIQILSLLKKYHGNLTEVAKSMGFSRTTLYRKLKIYNISRESI